jgi:alkanesulfonate monooxygenase SsuD/methylene tetrahydromethanopterin reductase-like flavin-dependent oxidoreductase (luciferase family)
MWSDNNGPYQGKHYQLAETLCVPAPISSPHPPIMIGGGGEKKTLRLAAKYADACNVFATGREEVAHKLDVLRAHCEAEGRDYDRIAKTAAIVRPVLGDVDAFIADVAAYAALGVTEVQLMPDRHPVEYMEQVAEKVIPRVAEIG